VIHIEKECAKGSAAAAMPGTKGWPRGFLRFTDRKKRRKMFHVEHFKSDSSGKNMKKHKKVGE
jgi:hypothetical protein